MAGFEECPVTLPLEKKTMDMENSPDRSDSKCISGALGLVWFSL